MILQKKQFINKKLITQKLGRINRIPLNQNQAMIMVYP